MLRLFIIHVFSEVLEDVDYLMRVKTIYSMDLFFNFLTHTHF